MFACMLNAVIIIFRLYSVISMHRSSNCSLSVSIKQYFYYLIGGVIHVTSLKTIKTMIVTGNIQVSLYARQRSQ